jgi:hypothetical protein
VVDKSTRWTVEHARSIPAPNLTAIALLLHDGGPGELV